MSRTIQDRIEERMKALNLNPSSTAIKGGLDRATVRKLLDDRDIVPTLPTVRKLATALETTEQWLLHEEGLQSQPAPRASEVRTANVTMPLPYEMPKDVPVMGTAAGSHLRGAFQLQMGDPVDYVRRPPTLMHAKNIYSLYVEGESMVPQYWPADLLFINPDKPPRIGDAVVIQVQAAEGHYEATLGILLRRSAEWVIIQKHNPKAEVQLARSTVLHIHKVLSPNEIYGV